MKERVVAEVSQYSRTSGRTSAQHSLENMEHERAQLKAEKQRLEAQLSAVMAEKRDALTNVYRRGLNKSEACAATNAIEAKFHKDKSRLVFEKAAVEERLHDIKGRAHDLLSKQPQENVAVLQRIEALLIEIRDKLGT